ncbi:hypothetical protein J1N35_031221, partial [Gossypium stocksii]
MEFHFFKIKPQNLTSTNGVPTERRKQESRSEVKEKSRFHHRRPKRRHDHEQGQSQNKETSIKNVTVLIPSSNAYRLVALI